MAVDFKVKTSNEKKQIVVNIFSDIGDKRLLIIGYDADANILNADYFRRELFIDKGGNKFIFNMPTSPKELEIVIFDPSNKENDDWYKVMSVEKTALKQFPLMCDRITSDFVHFSEWFSQQCGSKPVNNYTDPKRQFLLKMRDVLPDENGIHVPTPARTHKTKNFIEVHRESYYGMTVPMRHIITLHEYSHNFLNDEQNNETQADLNALSLYMPLRYSYVEAIYAFTRIFGDTDNNVSRLNFIDEYLKENNLEKRNNKQQYLDEDYYTNNNSIIF